MKKILCVCIVVLTAWTVFAAEFSDGRVKLVLNERTGRFSLYYMADLAAEEYLPVFVDEDPRTSFLSVMANKRSYKMGESTLFRTSLGGTPSSPALVFESAFLVVTEQFSFVKTGSSGETNGVTITITVTNKTEQAMETGIRFLVDTVLGEKEAVHFYTNSREIGAETSVDISGAERYWLSKSSRLALMGSIGQSAEAPGTVLFGNWKRLNDAAWKPAVMPGRNFNLLPYSIEDSAVCYFYEPVDIAGGASRTMSLTLSAGDSAFPANSADSAVAASSPGEPQIPDNAKEAAPANAAVTIAGLTITGLTNSGLANTPDSIEADLIALRDLITLLESYASSKTPVSAGELEAVALLISGIKSKYSIP